MQFGYVLANQFRRDQLQLKMRQDHRGGDKLFVDESYPCIDAIGGSGARVYDRVVGQCDRMEYR